MRIRINRTTGQPIRTEKELYLKRKTLGIALKEYKYKKLCRELPTIN